MTNKHESVFIWFEDHNHKHTTSSSDNNNYSNSSLNKEANKCNIKYKIYIQFAQFMCCGNQMREGMKEDFTSSGSGCTFLLLIVEPFVN